MKTAVIAIDPMFTNEETLAQFANMVRSLQYQGTIDRLVIASVMHHAQFLVPFYWYLESKTEFRFELFKKVKQATKNKFGTSRIVMLDSASPHPEDIAESLNRYAKAIGAEALVLLDTDRGVISRAFLGSVTRAADEIAEVPLIVVKPDEGKIILKEAEASRKASSPKFQSLSNQRESLPRGAQPLWL